MNHITIAGGLTKDAELRRTQGGEAILGFSVGVGEWRDKPSTYFSCSLWGKRGEALQFLKKGDRVTVCGDLSLEEYNGRPYLKVRVDQITLQGGKPAAPSNDYDAGYSQPTGGAPAGGRGDMDDLIPFATQFL